MPSLYPPEIVHTQFTDAVVAPTVAPMKALRVFRTAFNRAIHNTVTQPVVQLRDIVLQVPATGVVTGKSFDGYPGANVRSNSREKRLHFAPDVETVHLHWDLGGASQITVLAFEVYKTNTAAPLYRATMNFVVGACPPAGHFSWNGRLDQDLVCAGAAVVCTPNYLAAEFPGDALCVEQGPYKFKLVVLDPGATLVRITPARWVYADVLLGKPTLDWLPRNTLAASPTLPTNGLAPLQRDHLVYDALTDANDHENLSGAVPAPGQTKRLYLRGHAFYTQAGELVANEAWHQFHALWGEGPNIPLRLKPTLKRSDDQLVDGPTALPGLGAIRHVWEWVDAARLADGAMHDQVDSTDFRVGLTANGNQGAAQAAAQAFLNGALEFDVAATQPPGRNCHVERGGKRGPGAPAVFPAQVAGGVFPFAVAAGAGHWCAVSSLARNGDHEGWTGAILQPSIQAGDAYVLRVAPVLPGIADPATAFAPFRQAMDDVPATLRCDSGRFEVWKKIQHTVYTSDPRGLSPAVTDRMKLRFDKLFVRVDTAFAPTAAYIMHRDQIYNGTAPSSPALDPVVALALAGAANHGPPERGLTFKPWTDFRDALILQHGNLAQACLWAHGFAPANIQWRSSDGFCPLEAIWPHQIVAPVAHHADLAEHRVDVSITGTDALGPAVTWNKSFTAAEVAREVKNMVSMVCGGIGHFHHAGDPPLQVSLACHPDEEAQARLDIATGVKAHAEESNAGIYDGLIGRDWGFHALSLIIADMTGTLDGLVTFQWESPYNASSPPGAKAGFAGANRAALFIYMLKNDDMVGTLCHEFGHALFVNHPFYEQQGVNDPRHLHDEAAPHNCTLQTPAAQRNFCGFCMLRLRAWSIYKLDANRAAEAINPAPLPVVPDMHVRTLLRTGAQNTR